MMLDYFYGQSGELFSYFRIPKALFQDHRFRQLSTDARTLYGILLDRMSLSAKNGWLDEQGRVYIIYTVREVQEYGKHLKVFEPTIPRSVRAAETSAAGKSIFQHDPKGKVAEAYQSLAKEVLADADRQRKLSSERAR